MSKKGREPHRRIGASFWTSPVWRETPPGPHQNVLLWLAVGPEQAMAPGVLPIGEGRIADALQMELAAVRAVLGAFAARGILQQDRKHQLLWLPWRFDDERPDNVSQVIGWRKKLDAVLPRCELACAIRRELRARLQECDPSFAVAFGGDGAPPPSPHTVRGHGVPPPKPPRSGRTSPAAPVRGDGDAGRKRAPAGPTLALAKKAESKQDPAVETVSPDSVPPPSGVTVGGHQGAVNKEQTSRSDQRRRSQAHQTGEEPPPLEELERVFPKDLALQISTRVSASLKTWCKFAAEALEEPSRHREAAAREFLRRGCPAEGLGPAYLLAMIREGAGNPTAEPGLVCSWCKEHGHELRDCAARATYYTDHPERVEEVLHGRA